MSLETQADDMNFLRRAAELSLRDKGEENGCSIVSTSVPVSL